MATKSRKAAIEERLAAEDGVPCINHLGTVVPTGRVAGDVEIGHVHFFNAEGKRIAETGYKGKRVGVEMLPASDVKD